MSSTRDCPGCGREAGFHRVGCTFGNTVTRDELQTRVLEWVRETFGEETFNPRERVLRFLEEAIELAQAEAVPYAQAVRVLNHVYDKPPGDPLLEVGGVGTTLLAYCASKNVSADQAERTEAARVFAIDQTYFRERHNAKAAAGIAAWTDARVDKVSLTHNHPIDCACSACGGLR